MRNAADRGPLWVVCLVWEGCGDPGEERCDRDGTGETMGERLCSDERTARTARSSFARMCVRCGEIFLRCGVIGSRVLSLGFLIIKMTIQVLVGSASYKMKMMTFQTFQWLICASRLALA